MRNLYSLIVFLLFVICAEQLIAQPPVNVQQRQQRYRQLLQRFDVDGNGKLDREEFSSWISAGVMKSEDQFRTTEIERQERN